VNVDGLVLDKDPTGGGSVGAILQGPVWFYH
jgi:hypothetical protein